MPKNAWLEHVAAYRAAHPGVSYREALVAASATYKPKAAPKKPAAPAGPKGCRMGPKKRCVSYGGPDRDGCMRGPSGTCRDAAGLAKAYAPKRAPTAKQLQNLEKARRARAAKAQAAQAAKAQVGGYWW